MTLLSLDQHSHLNRVMTPQSHQTHSHNSTESPDTLLSRKQCTMWRTGDSVECLRALRVHYVAHSAETEAVHYVAHSAEPLCHPQDFCSSHCFPGVFPVFCFVVSIFVLVCRQVFFLWRGGLNLISLNALEKKKDKDI